MSKADEKADQPNASVDDVSSGIVDDTVVELDPELERRTLRKFDKFLLPPLAIILLLAYLDRSNLGKHIDTDARYIHTNREPHRQRKSFWF